jgi:hypothetical protein
LLISLDSAITANLAVGGLTLQTKDHGGYSAAASPNVAIKGTSSFATMHGCSRFE